MANLVNPMSIVKQRTRILEELNSRSARFGPQLELDSSSDC